eukprot:TRINITY_DN24889_c0_g1_i1.p1 TRINITY_DN24889_c0_g1~~TRINITY_DN24889_c0_g1_i1.p1  ORF type:complete len:392 (+),score=52.72 TRINITY_DN24889_c0_g1_i1:334-1509(+)
MGSGRFSSITPSVAKRGSVDNNKENKGVKKVASKYGWSRPSDKELEERVRARLIGKPSGGGLRPVPNGSNLSRGTGYHCLPTRGPKKRTDPMQVYRPYSRTPNVPELNITRGPKEVYRSPSGTFVSPRHVSPMGTAYSSPRMHSPHPRESVSSAPLETPKGKGDRLVFDYDYIEMEKERVRREMKEQFERERARWERERAREASPQTDVSNQEKRALEELLEIEKAKIREELEDEFRRSKELWIIEHTPSPSPSPQRSSTFQHQIPTEEEVKRNKEQWMSEILEEERGKIRTELQQEFGKEKEAWLTEMQREVTEQWVQIEKKIKVKDTMISDLQAQLEAATGRQAYKSSDQHKNVEDYIKNHLSYDKQNDLITLDNELSELLGTEEAGEA